MGLTKVQVPDLSFYSRSLNIISKLGVGDLCSYVALATMYA